MRLGVGMSDALYADLLRSAVAELDRRAKSISQKAFVTIRVWPDRWTVNVWEIAGRQLRQFEGPKPAPLIEEALDLLTQHNPDGVMRTLGIEPVSQSETIA